MPNEANPTITVVDENTPIRVFFKPSIPYAHHRIAEIIPVNKPSLDGRLQKNVRFPGYGAGTVIALSRYILCVERGYDLQDNERVSYKDKDVYNYSRDNIHITPIPGSWDTPLQENPENGSRFKPEPPFDNYTRGYVQEGTFFGSKRRVVKLSNPGERPFELKCARYMKIVDHYRKTGEHVTDSNKHSHHINENPMDDRYANLEWKDAKLHHRHHLNQILHRKLIKQALCCPVCMTLFEKEVFDGPKHIPICCSILCHEKLITQYPIETSSVYLSDLASKQKVFVKTDANFLNFDLTSFLKENNIAPLV